MPFISGSVHAQMAIRRRKEREEQEKKEKQEAEASRKRRVIEENAQQEKCLRANEEIQKKYKEEQERKQVFEKIIERGEVVAVTEVDNKYKYINRDSYNQYSQLAKTHEMKKCLATLFLSRELSELRYDSLDSVRLALKDGADVNNLECPLHNAVKSDILILCQLLHEYKADLESSDVNANTSLHIAAKENEASIAEWLLEQKIDVNKENNMHQTALHLAGTSVTRILLTHPKVKIDAIDENGETPLFSAVRAMDYARAELLIAAGADLFLRNKKNQLLVDIIANPDPDSVWYKLIVSPILQKAVQENNYLLVETICQQFGFSSNGEQLLIAINNNNLQMVDLLINHGASVTSQMLDQASSSEMYNALFTRILKDKLTLFCTNEEKKVDAQYCFFCKSTTHLDAATMMLNILNGKEDVKSLKRFEKNIKKDPELRSLHTDFQLVIANTAATVRATKVADQILQNASMFSPPLARLITEFCINTREEKQVEVATPAR